VVRVGLSAARETIAGFGALKEHSSPRLIIALFGGQTIVRGSLSVLIVVAALRALGLGQPGVGYLNAAVGVGGLVGSAAALSLVGRRRLAAPFGLGLVLWGLPIALLGIWPLAPLAFLFLAVIGLANGIVDVAGLSLLQRTVPIDVLARVLGLLESLVMATIGLGSIAAPGLISLAGLRGAMIATGLALPLLTLAAWRSLVSVDAMAAAPGPELRLLQGVPFLAPLAPPVLEQLSLGMKPRSFPTGTAIVREGEPGTQFFVIGEGRARITVDGATVRTLGPGHYFGEIALLRDVPRTATVTAETEVSAYAIEREPFLQAVTGHSRSRDLGDAVLRAHGW
jgi:MFS family permease